MQQNNTQNANLILKKFKKSLKISTDIQLSEILNVKPNTISTWKKRNSVDYKLIISICELYEIDLNHIFGNQVKMVNNDPFALCETALVSKEQQFQYCIDKEEVIEHLPKYHFPFIKADGSVLFQVSSNNMSPMIEENSFAICEISSLKSISDDSLVVIISKSKGFFINKIIKSKENKEMFTLCNENAFYNDINIHAKDINEIWKIKGILSFNINTCPANETSTNEKAEKKKKVIKT